jgi:hypothetical protein
MRDRVKVQNICFDECLRTYCVKIQNPSPTWARQLDYSEQPQLYSLILIIPPDFYLQAKLPPNVAMQQLE